MKYDRILLILFLFGILVLFSSADKKTPVAAPLPPLPPPNTGNSTTTSTAPSTQTNGEVLSTQAPVLEPVPTEQVAIASISINNYYSFYDIVTDINSTLWFNVCKSKGAKLTSTSDIYFTKSDCSILNGDWTASSPQIVDINRNTLGVCVDTSSGISLSSTCSQNMTIPVDIGM